jgi:hypothetical protein
LDWLEVSVATDSGGAEAVAELGMRVVTDIDLDLLPEPFIVPDLLAERADRYDTAQCPGLGQRLLKRQSRCE